MATIPVYKKRTDENGNPVLDSYGIEIMDLIGTKWVDDVVKPIEVGSDQQYIDPLYVLDNPPLREGE